MQSQSEEELALATEVRETSPQALKRIQIIASRCCTPERRAPPVVTARMHLFLDRLLLQLLQLLCQLLGLIPKLVKALRQ